jgi:hypothetical protein
MEEFERVIGMIDAFRGVKERPFRSGPRCAREIDGIAASNCASIQVEPLAGNKWKRDPSVLNHSKVPAMSLSVSSSNNLELKIPQNTQSSHKLSQETDISY